MQVFVSYFQKIREMSDPSIVLVSTATKWPFWIYQDKKRELFIDSNGLLNGISEESFLLSDDEIPDEMCAGRPCPYENKKPCKFLESYWNHLQKIDFDGYLIPELNRIAEEVRKITHFEGEPKIVLLVYEKPDNPCSERGPLIRLFKEHGIELKEWTKEVDPNLVF